MSQAVPHSLSEYSSYALEAHSCLYKYYKRTSHAFLALSEYEHL